ncbi:helix-hairpin-helix domain-containing protein [Alkalibacillus aidingensis]|uniref:helix-hairpin-helix domain-containing protein n=1 Tax=Alkalibacillus aidingensis TaxID=2747607 RepID=UPI0016602126|nr:helix-hairpin-helix domain-containing protein [Alkalibacillus aidingensis]
MLDVTLERANVLKGLADFQSVPSIGYKLAEKLVFELSIFSLSKIKDHDGAKLFAELEQKLDQGRLGMNFLVKI